MVMWVLAIGRWLLVARCFCWHESCIIVGIVKLYIPIVFFSGLKYLDRTKIYLACPDMLNKIEAILYLDQI
jgi:hypothetical protein